ncbi:RNA-binding protein 45-like [Anticarsia gemmatalis]|uniref:RNA-binding protein 45-like n=1 Tax=Anticarsia gemmatalis TaxID=129554 RepID=UPI003F777932
MNSRRKHNEDTTEDSPAYSRLFLVCDRRYKEDDFKEAFSKFGTIEDIRIPRDYNTGEPRGVAYIKFSKTSEAAAALEEMNKKCLRPSDRPLKVMVAANRSDIQTDRNEHDSDRFNRLFITVPKSVQEDDISEAFSRFGHIESIVIQKDRNTGEPRGFAYVKFRKFSEAAVAFEEAPREYRAIFAMPKQDITPVRTAFESNINDLATTSTERSTLISLMNTRSGGFTQVSFMCCPRLTQMHIECLFDIVPGMVGCQFLLDLARNCGKGYVSYSNPISAAYAVQKLNEFEYPPGLKIFVKPFNSKFDHHEQNYKRIPSVAQNLKQAVQAAANSATPDLAQLAEAIAEASKLIKMATAGISEDHDSNDLNYCSVQLPAPQPLADIDSEVAKRCFLVCKPQPPPLTVLRDIFCRFGDLINVYTLPNKTVGYARYASVSAADEAIKTLHGAEVCGVRIKVIEAEEENSAKRRRFD